jgi:Flp pilus assembly protein TadD
MVPCRHRHNEIVCMIASHFARGLRMRVRLVPLIAAAVASGCDRISPQPDDLLASAREQAAARHHRAAIIQLRNVLQQSPRHAEALYLLGLEYSRAGDSAAALRPLLRALDLGYDPAKGIAPLSKSLIATGDYQRALDRATVDLRGDNRTQAEFHALRGLAYLGLKRNREASDS